jgi:hypothetical protein
MRLHIDRVGIILGAGREDYKDRPAVCNHNSSLKLRDQELYFAQSEKNPRTTYRVNFKDRTYTWTDFKKEGEAYEHFYKVVMEDIS